MPSVKTAVSIPESLFIEAENLARELDISRSRLFSVALESFIEQRKNQHLFEQIDAAYSDGHNFNEQTYQVRMKNYHRRFVEGKW